MRPHGRAAALSTPSRVAQLGRRDIPSRHPPSQSGFGRSPKCRLPRLAALLVRNDDRPVAGVAGVERRRTAHTACQEPRSVTPGQRRVGGCANRGLETPRRSSSVAGSPPWCAMMAPLAAVAAVASHRLPTAPTAASSAGKSSSTGWHAAAPPWPPRSIVWPADSAVGLSSAAATGGQRSRHARTGTNLARTGPPSCGLVRGRPSMG